MDDAWVCGAGGAGWAHRHCLVQARLEDARYHHDQAAYARAKREVYPLPSTQLPPDHLLHRVPSGAEWSRTQSFRQLPQPEAGLAAEHAAQQRQRRQQQLEGAGSAAECGCGRERGCSRCSSNSSLGCSTASCDSGSSGAVGAPDACRQRALLRRPSPVHHPALLEARTLRRLSGPHPSFDRCALRRGLGGDSRMPLARLAGALIQTRRGGPCGSRRLQRGASRLRTAALSRPLPSRLLGRSEALLMDADGGCGKEWRAAQRARQEEERLRAQRAAQRAAEANGF